MILDATKQIVKAVKEDLKLFNIPMTARMLEALTVAQQAIAEAESYHLAYPDNFVKEPEPLTSERIAELWSQYNPLLGIESFVRTIEAEIKEAA